MNEKGGIDRAERESHWATFEYRRETSYVIVVRKIRANSLHFSTLMELWIVQFDMLRHRCETPWSCSKISKTPRAKARAGQRTVASGLLVHRQYVY